MPGGNAGGPPTCIVERVRVRIRCQSIHLLDKALATSTACLVMVACSLSFTLMLNSAEVPQPAVPRMPILPPPPMAEPPAAPLQEAVLPRRRLLSVPPGAELRPDCRPLPAERLDHMIRQSAQRHDVEEWLLKRIVQRESAGRPCAVSGKGAVGLMQLMPDTARAMGLKAHTVAEQNLDAGTRYLKTLLTRYNNDVKLALAAYNAGPGRVDQYGGVPPFKETREYVAEIFGGGDPRKSRHGAAFPGGESVMGASSVR